jgi:hypothetical protein
MRFDTREVQRVGLGRVETRPGAPAAVVVFADEDRVGEERLYRSRRGVRLELNGGIQVALVEAVEVDLERAPDVGLVARGVVERRAVDLDRAIVARGIRRRRGARQSAHHDGNYETRGRRQQPGPDQDAAASRQHLGTLHHGCCSLPSPRPNPGAPTCTALRVGAVLQVPADSSNPPRAPRLSDRTPRVGRAPPAAHHDPRSLETALHRRLVPLRHRLGQHQEEVEPHRHPVGARRSRLHAHRLLKRDSAAIGQFAFAHDPSGPEGHTGIGGGQSRWSRRSVTSRLQSSAAESPTRMVAGY